MRINEIFYSIQGEGSLAGVPSIFIRVAGCNLKCIWCDTKNASWNNKGYELTLEQIVDKISGLPDYRHIVITGGEPTISKEMSSLTNKLKNLGRHITIETNGTCFDPFIKADLISISPKLSHSVPEKTCFEEDHIKSMLNLEAIKQWIKKFDYQLKFVVSEASDLIEINEIIQKLGIQNNYEKIILMALGVEPEMLTKKEKWIIGECIKYGYRFSPRLHITLGTV